jgi:hypothetical protein
MVKRSFKKAAARKTAKKKPLSKKLAPKKKVTAKKKVVAKKKSSPRVTKKRLSAKAKAPKRNPAKRTQTKSKLSVEIRETAERVLRAAEVEGLMQRLPPPMQPIMKSLRRIMNEAAPNAVEFLEKNAAAYDANGVFARIEPHESRVLIKFMKGGLLPSADALESVEGDERTLALDDVTKIQQDVLKKLVREAVLHNLKSRA